MFKAVTLCRSYFSLKVNRKFCANVILYQKTKDSCQEKKPASKSPCDEMKGAKNPCGSDSDKGKAPEIKSFKVYRFQGIESKKAPFVQTYELDTSKCGSMVLDALLKLKDMDPGLTFRKSCREGICGSCAVNLQGMNCLACITEIPKASTVTIMPLPHMYVIRDLVVDMTHFFKGYDSIKPYLIRNKEVKMGTTQYAQSIKDNLKLIGLYECVLCACCSTSCPSYWWNGRKFLGPASLLHAYRWVIDSRDDDTLNRMQDLSDDFRAYRCHSIFNCQLVCPKGLMPGANIARLKRLIAKVTKKPPPEADPLKFTKKDQVKHKRTCK